MAQHNTVNLAKNANLPLNYQSNSLKFAVKLDCNIPYKVPITKFEKSIKYLRKLNYKFMYENGVV